MGKTHKTRWFWEETPLTYSGLEMFPKRRGEEIGAHQGETFYYTQKAGQILKGIQSGRSAVSEFGEVKTAEEFHDLMRSIRMHDASEVGLE